MSKSSEDLSAREKELLSMMLTQSIAYFPFGKALSLPQSEQNEDMEDMVEKIKLDVEDVKSEIKSLQRLLDCSVSKNEESNAIIQDLLESVKELKALTLIGAEEGTAT